MRIREITGKICETRGKGIPKGSQRIVVRRQGLINVFSLDELFTEIGEKKTERENDIGLRPDDTGGERRDL